MDTVNFHLKPAADVDSVWERLEYYGCELLYSSEDGHEKVIVGVLPKNIAGELLQEQIPEIENIEASSLALIDWESQWAAHGAGYSEGYVHVDLYEYTQDGVVLKVPKVQLKAGPGFGDLSHPTTRLVLRLMAPLVSDKYVVDIGSGSGVLSVAACAMGASVVEGIDIDPAALTHASENCRLNGMEGLVSFMLPEDYEGPEKCASTVVLMNMIQSEQQQAWSSLPQLHSSAGPVIASGILTEGREPYLALTGSWGWRLVEEAEEDGWLGFHFER